MISISEMLENVKRFKELNPELFQQSEHRIAGLSRNEYYRKYRK